jgi:outer membrane protein assembly factor BamB
MSGKGKPQYRHWLPRARTAALALPVLFVLSNVPALAEQGVTVGPYWQVEVEGRLTALAVDDLDGDGWTEIMTGTDEGQVTLWRAEGEAAWTFDIETDWVTSLSTGDLEGDGTKKVFVTAAGILPTSYLYVLGADGQLLWSHSVRDELWGAVLLDLDADGRQEVLLAAQRPVALDDDGSELADWPVHALRTPHVHVTDLDGDGADEVLVVTELEVVIIEPDGASWAWPHGLDSPIVASRTADLDGDGRGEVIIATDTAVVLFQDDGNPGWTYPIEEQPGDLRAGDGLGVLVASGTAVVQLTASGDEAWRFVSPSAPSAALRTGSFRAGPLALSAAASLDVADPDAGGMPEVVFGTISGPVYLLDTDGEPMAEYPVAGPVTLVRYADLNGDGCGEVLIGSEGFLSVFGSPAGVAATHLRWAYATRGAVTDLSAGDVDGDGMWEVVVGGRDKKVTLLDKDGMMVWQFAAAAVVDGMSASKPGEILVHAGRCLYLLAGDGTLMWQRTFDSPLRAAVRAQEPVEGIAVGLEDGRAMLLAPEDGAEQWSHPFDRAVEAGSVSEELPGMVVGLGDGRVARLDDQGRLLWEQDVGRIVSWLAVADVDHDRHDDVIARSGDTIYLLRAGDGAMIWRTDTQAERLTDIALDDGVIVGTDRRVYRLDATARETWSYSLDEVSSAVYATALNGECETSPSGCGQAEVAVGTVKGGIYLLGTDGRFLWQGKGRERVNALHAADLNGDGRQELLVGMEDGLVQAYGLAVNQVPWLSAPRVMPVGGGYVYSVRVRDPDGDDVQVTLEIWDPSARTWLAQEKTTAPGGKGTLSWNLPNPFDTWDAGHDSRFRFTWDDGQSRSTVAAVAGPWDIPVAPWYVFYGRYVLALAVVGAVPTLLLVIVRRTRAYRRSPVGQAEAFLLRLTLEPEALLPELHRLVIDESRGMVILPHLPGLARQASDEMIAGLAEGYYLILTHSDAPRVTEGLKTIVGALAEKDRASPLEMRWKREAEQLYELLLAGLQANSVPRIVALSGPLGSLGAILGDSDTSTTPSTSFFLADVARLLAQLRRISRTLSSFEQVESSGDKIAYLAEAMEVLGRCDRQARSDLIGPEQTILIHVVTNWLAVVTGALTGLRGRAQLAIALKTRRTVTAGEEVVLVLALNNVGRSPAANLVIELLPGAGYTVRDGLAEVAVLPVDRTADVELRARPSPSVDTFRAEFRVTYDDRERTGKTEIFADRVRLVTPPAVFRPIPNPYATGRPLRAGSPVFFGREDVFAFIRENLGGPGSENILVLVGQRRVGKTSILRQLPAHLSDDYFPAFLDGQALGIEGGMAGLFYDIALEISEALAVQGIVLEPPDVGELEEKLSLAFEKRFLPQVAEALGERVLVLLFDEFEELEMRVRSGELPPTVFAYLRHLMQHSKNVTFIFAGTHRLEELTADYWAILFNIALYKQVDFLDMESARRLVVEPVQSYGLLYDDLAIDKMLRVTTGHPYFLQLLCHSLVNLHNRERLNYITIQEVNHTLEEITRLGEAHLAFLWGESTKEEQAVLMALTRLISAGEPGTRGAIAGLLGEHGFQIDSSETSEVAERLVQRGITREMGPEADRYEFTVDLMRLWIEGTKSLSRIIEDIT